MHIFAPTPTSHPLIDFFAIFKSTGLLLWRSNPDPFNPSQLNTFIIEALSKLLSKNYTTVNDLDYHWRFSSKFNLVFLCITRQIYNFKFIPDLIIEMEKYFDGVYDGAELSTYQTGQVSSFYIDKIGELESAGDVGLKSVGKKKKDGVKNVNKKQRKWLDSYTKSDMKELDMNPENGEIKEDEITDEMKLIMDKKSSVVEKKDEALVTTENMDNKVQNFLLSLIGQKTITESELERTKEKIVQNLVGLNVAVSTAENIVNNAFARILGKKIGILGISASTVRKELTNSINHIIQKSYIDILEEISASKSKSKQYTIILMGVNGVGKSTTISKLCFLFLSHGFSVAVVGGDTFRSGAIEQLNVHVKRLKKLFSNDMIELYQKGYGKDPITVFNEASKLSRNKFDVMIVDTAGRMQGNKPLMKSLSLFINEVNFDKNIFVGEALVGNEGLDQLRMFKESLQSYSKTGSDCINGLIITKVDTVGDMVGSILNMSYISNAPILFIGTGQQYTDLHPLNADKIINQLITSL